MAKLKFKTRFEIVETLYDSLLNFFNRKPKKPKKQSEKKRALNAEEII